MRDHFPEEPFRPPAEDANQFRQAPFLVRFLFSLSRHTEESISTEKASLV